MRKFFVALAVVFMAFIGPAAHAYPILTPDYPSVYWDETCDIHGTRPQDVVNPGNIGNITYIEEDNVTVGTETHWIVWAHLDDPATSWVSPLPNGWSYTAGTSNRTIEVHYLTYYCG